MREKVAATAQRVKKYTRRVMCALFCSVAIGTVVIPAKAFLDYNDTEQKWKARPCPDSRFSEDKGDPSFDPDACHQFPNVYEQMPPRRLKTILVLWAIGTSLIWLLAWCLDDSEPKKRPARQ